MNRSRAFVVSAALLAARTAALHAGQPHMSVTPDAIPFGTAQVGTTVGGDSVNIQNDPGGSDLSYSVTLSAGDTGDFLLSCDGGGSACLSGIVPAGQTKTVIVAFHPIASGARSATLTVSGNDFANPSEPVALSGTGIDLVFANGFEPGDVAWSSCVGCIDASPPATIEDLSAQPGAAAGTVDLQWTAPTEDTLGGGAAADYVVRYSATDILDEVDWENAGDIFPLPTPSAPGSTEQMTVTSLVPGGSFYFVVRAWDEASNLSPLGPSAFAQATPEP
jgi:hypothetical protein